ncbi:2OG-Fe oxygenase family protein [Cryptosporidium andersoni]|uniref:2OG-Fe oxygenase family protein n=1 Tax=Cryptosporidium andersoni TaxID=117008 RepID=A0A1J4MUC8_9CRYT|nr:2OG-Fe oxygenase family protein [Cryptosporidium andersoni]
MSENCATVNDETKHILKDLTPPKPKLLNSTINMVPINDVNLTTSGTMNSISGFPAVNSLPQLSSAPVSTTQIPTLTASQIQQAMANIQLNNPNIATITPGINSTNYNIPPVSTLDPNILSTAGINIQKPVLQPVQIPNVGTTIPNLCGIQGQDMDLMNWMQKQRIALALSQMQGDLKVMPNSEKNLANMNTFENNFIKMPTNSTTSDSLLNNLNVNINGTQELPLTPQLTTFLGNSSLVPTVQTNQGVNNFSNLNSVLTTSSLNKTSEGITPGINMKCASNLGNFQSSNIQQIQAMVENQQKQYVNNQLSAAAQLLRQHGIRATIGTEPISGKETETINQSTLLQRIVASKVNPKIQIVPNALSEEECNEIINFIQDRLESSKISMKKSTSNSDINEIDKDNEITNSDQFCKSLTACIQPEETPLIKMIERRLALLVDTPIINLEPILVHKYDNGGYIKEHHDGETRSSTICVFLETISSGGELDFPYAGIKIKPKKGFAVIWPNINEEDKIDHTTIHAVNIVNEDTALYLLYLHVNKSPARMHHEAYSAVKQIVERESLPIPDTVQHISYS